MINLNLRAKILLDWPVDSLMTPGWLRFWAQEGPRIWWRLHGFLHDDGLQTDGFVPSDVGVNMWVLSGGTRVSGESGIAK